MKSREESTTTPNRMVRGEAGGGGYQEGDRPRARPGFAAGAVLAAGLALLAACTRPDPSREPTEDTGGTPAPTEAEGRGAATIWEAPAVDEAVVRRREGFARGAVKHSWWNQEAIVENVGLREEQRERMDTAVETYLEAVWRTQDERTALEARFEKAILAGDLTTAGALQAHNATLGYPHSSAYQRLVVDVLSALDDTQSLAFRESYSHILGRRWIRHMPLGTQRDRPGRRSRSGAQSRPDGTPADGGSGAAPRGSPHP